MYLLRSRKHNAKLNIPFFFKMNNYDEPEFFEKYMKLHRCKSGFEASDEWYKYKDMLPNFENKRVLDLGCGPGLHSEYAAAHGASKVVGIDLSFRMINQAKLNNANPAVVQYEVKSITDIDYPPGSFDAVISAMALHYVRSFEDIVCKVNQCLAEGGDFVFSTTNPIFTASGDLQWCHKENDVHWKVSNYFDEERIDGDFLGEEVHMYHRTMSTFVNTLLKNGFKIIEVAEPKPIKGVDTDFPFDLEVRRPRFLIISAKKINSIN